jgi:hypothetical protein
MTALPLAYPSLHLDGLANYQTLPGLRASHLKAALVSLKAYKHALANPLVPTPAMLEGTAFDRWLLSGQEPAWEPEVNRRTNAGKQELADFAAAHEGRAIVRGEMRPAFVAMRDAVLTHPLAGRIIERSHHHAVALWRDDESGLCCKAEADCLADPCGLMPVEADLKRTVCITPHAMQRQAWDKGWLLQRAFYRWGFLENDIDLAAQYLIAVSPEPPHECVVYEPDAADLEECDAIIRRAVAAIAKATADNVWPGIDGGRLALPLRAPKWALNEPQGATLDEDKEQDDE